LRGCVTGIVFFANDSIVNSGEEPADTIPTERLISPVGVTGPSDDAEDVGDDESEWNGEGGVLGGEGYRGSNGAALTGFRRGTCCSFWCSYGVFGGGGGVELCVLPNMGIGLVLEFGGTGACDGGNASAFFDENMDMT
jgi:hypothetical protein